ncbi:MAG: S8 family serine peptidase [Bdellovibrionales bacterium]
MKKIIFVYLALVGSLAQAGEYILPNQVSLIAPPDMRVTQILHRSQLRVVEMSETSAELMKRAGMVVEANNPVYALSLEPSTSVPAPSDWHMDAVRAREAHALGGDGTGITVCLVDSGVVESLPDLAPAIVGGVNVTTDNPNDYVDQNGHGTSLAGLIAGRGVSRVLGVAPASSLFVVRVLDKDGIGTIAQVTEGILACIGHSQVINLSLGSFETSPSIQAAVDRALDAGVLVIAAAGNAGERDLSFPARYGPVIGVGASTMHGLRAPFSNYGPDLDFLAPGVDIELLDLRGEVRLMSGNSMSAAIASGVAAIHRSQMGLSLIGRTLSIPQEEQGGGLIDAVLSMQK